MKTQVLRIGRKPDNDIVIDDLSVSHYHAVATLGNENTAELEDNDSSNGTYVDGMRVRKTLITGESSITLGKVALDPRKIFRFNKKPDDFSAEFQELRPVWDTLETERISILQSQKKIDVLLAIPYIGRIIMLWAANHYNLEGRRVKLKEDMRRMWVCPSCKQPLRDYEWLTWNDAEHLRRCPKCKARWF
ncbi:hypothetical protein DYBT9275_01458 [Dyadobacter sp. CECT 9275]|uniref:FHA domain-containing protein n=1 Tax=Dyadobacter helix TaxID=2822344 RepID=A0A916JC42_9BACT|nr:FHA domain-containing protein [Dyadobacter sp. CECT 9275]CAG4994746.1 hypothetical protein DYBT9275_01458 [Dyadobacter sp. CECT 9275]